MIVLRHKNSLSVKRKSVIITIYEGLIWRALPSVSKVGSPARLSDTPLVSIFYAFHISRILDLQLSSCVQRSTVVMVHNMTTGSILYWVNVRSAADITCSIICSVYLSVQSIHICSIIHNNNIERHVYHLSIELLHIYVVVVKDRIENGVTY